MGLLTPCWCQSTPSCHLLPLRPHCFEYIHPCFGFSPLCSPTRPCCRVRRNDLRVLAQVGGCGPLFPICMADHTQMSSGVRASPPNGPIKDCYWPSLTPCSTVASVLWVGVSTGQNRGRNSCKRSLPFRSYKGSGANSEYRHANWERPAHGKDWLWRRRKAENFLSLQECRAWHTWTTFTSKSSYHLFTQKLSH